jgi:hypothetical protein
MNDARRRRDVLIDLINQVHAKARRSMENSLLAAVGVTILGLAGFIGQVSEKAIILAASISCLGTLLWLFFVLILAKVMNLVLEALFDHYSRTYAVYVFGVWFLSILVAVAGLALVAERWYAALQRPWA